MPLSSPTITGAVGKPRKYSRCCAIGSAGRPALGPCRGRREPQVRPRVAEEVTVRHAQPGATSAVLTGEEARRRAAAAVKLPH